MRVASKTHHFFFNLRSWLVLVRDRSSRKGITNMLLTNTFYLRIRQIYSTILSDIEVQMTKPHP